MFTPSKRYLDVPASEYVALGAEYERGDEKRVMSRSELKRFAWCPSRWLAGHADSDTESTEWGGMIDCGLLTPEEFALRYIVSPVNYPCEPTKKDPRTEKPWNRNADFCRQWEKDQAAAGLIAIKPDEQQEARNAIDRARENPKFAAVLDGARTQVFACVDYRDEATGLVIPVKTLIDIAPVGPLSKYLADLKTTKNAHPKAWAREVDSRWYDAQAWLHMEAYCAVYKEDRCGFVHLKQENYPPYETATQQLSVEFISGDERGGYRGGRGKILDALALYCRCIKTGDWPTFDDAAGDSFDGFPICQPEPYMILHGN